MNSELIKLKTMCRICSTIEDKNDFIPLFEGAMCCKNFCTEVFAEIISFNLEVWKNDGLPQQICSKCIRTFSAVSHFRKRCQNIQIELRKNYFKKENNSEGMSDDAQIPSEMELTTVEKTNSFICSSNDFINNSQEKSIAALEEDYADDESNWKCEYIEPEDEDNKADPAIINAINKYEIGKSVSGSFQICEATYSRNKESCDFGDVYENVSSNRSNRGANTTHESAKEERSEKIISSNLPYIGKEENEKNNEKQNSDQPEKDYKYSCKYCRKGFHWSILLSNHIKRCPERNVVCCEICTTEFKSNELLDKHMNEDHPLGGPPMCPICSNTFEDAKKRDTHIRLVHSKREEHKCTVCNRIFMSKLYLANHIKRNHVVGNYECPICHMKFSILSKYKYHVSSHDENKKIKCKYCEKPFGNSYRCSIHETSHTGERPHLCNICGLSFRYIFEFKEHLKGHTMNSFECEECKKHFSNPRQLKNHKRLMHDTSPHPCDICGKMVRQALLAKHKNRVHNEKNRKQPTSYPFNCPICPKGYKTAPSLASHVKIHTENRQHECKECGCAFKRADHLQLHIKRIHLKITCFTCECGKKFLERCALKAHKITHTDETPFKCSECPRAFKTNRSLQSHKLRHTGERPYACGICVMRFSSRAAVVLHTQKHSHDQKKLVEEEARLEVANALGCKMFTVDEKCVELEK